MASDLDSVIDALLERIKLRTVTAFSEEIEHLSTAVLSLARARAYGRPLSIPSGLALGAAVKPAALEVE